MNQFKTAIIISALLWFGLSSYAQKLPNVQKVSLRAPNNIKIDAKITEWGNQFQAYNHATDIFYTIANNDENLYLIVQAKDPDVINKIVGGGISFIINKSNNKRDEISITYPINDGKNKPYFSLTPNKKNGFFEDASHRAIDSIKIHNNKILEQKLKWIRTIGIEGMDNMISVYNNDGINALGLFDDKRVYTVEMAIKLKYLRLSIDKPTSFTYHIILNGSNALDMGFTPMPDNSSTAERDAIIAGYFAKMENNSNKLAAPTSFWGVYTLAKK